MYYNFMKLTLPMMLTIFLVGCGGSDDNTVPPEEINYPEFVSNKGKPVGVLGHYGDDVYFGDQKIVGKWRTRIIEKNGSVAKPSDIDSNYWFYSDETGQTKGNQISSGGAISITYGIDSSAILVTSTGLGNSLKIYSIIGYKDNCLKIFLTDVFVLTYDNPELAAGTNHSFYLCKEE